MEETGTFVAATFITKSGSSYWSSYTMMAAYLPISARTVKTILPYGPGFPLDAVRTASSTPQFAAAIA